MESNVRRAAMRIYESNQTRVQAMYRLPGDLRPRRVLELFVAGSRPVINVEWRAQTTVCSRAYGWGTEGATDTDETDAYDFALLHWTLDSASVGRERQAGHDRQIALLHEVSRALVPGGIVAGCVTNRYSLSHLRRCWIGRSGRGKKDVPTGHTPRSLQSMLKTSGIGDIEIFTALPSADNPEALVGTSRRASIPHFVRFVESRRGQSARISYIGRRLIAKAGLYGYLVGSLVFWGRKPCSMSSLNR